jgi:hypothetical protein
VTGLTSLLPLVSGFLTSGEVFAFGTLTLVGLVDGATLGLVTGVAVLVGVVLAGFTFSGVAPQAPKIAVEAARTVAKTIDLLIDLSLIYRSYSRFFQAAYNPMEAATAHQTDTAGLLTPV